MENVFENLKVNMEKERQELEKASPQPKNLSGFFIPGMFGEGMNPEANLDLAKRGCMAITGIGLAMAIIIAEEIGWEKFINLWCEKAGPGATLVGENLRKMLSVTGHSMVDMQILSVAGGSGAGFATGWDYEWSNRRTVGTQAHCDMIEACQRMGMGDKVGELRFWCDSYDSFQAKATNEDAWFSHGCCEGIGDKNCRWYKQPVPEGNLAGESFYHAIRRRSLAARKDMAANPIPPRVPGLGLPRAMEKWTPEDVVKRGRFGWMRITMSIAGVGVEALGWEKFIDLVAEKSHYGYAKAAVDTKAAFDVIGSSLQHAAVLAILHYLSFGFDNHHVIEFTDKRVEVVGHTCPVLDAIDEWKVLPNTKKEISLWCDYYHNHQIHTINPEFNLTHTHCLGRGDQYCRIVIK
jgi:hypothetical protein